MKQWKQWLSGLVRLGIGVGIVGFLVWNINRGSQRIRFAIEPATIARDAVYTPDTNAPTPYVVLEAVRDGTNLQVLANIDPEVPLADTGTLHRVEGEGPPTVQWRSPRREPYGLRMLAEAFRTASRRWAWLAAGVATFFACLGITAVRWQMLLRAQGLQLSTRRTWTLLFIGHFFNSFLFGATGGDVVKAYYAARETGHKKTEAASTVFIDRIMGLMALVLLAAGMMATRLRIFLTTPEAKAALLFIGALAAAVILGLCVLVFFQRLIDRFAFMQRLVETRVGNILHRIYTAFYICLSRPALFAKTFTLSFVNQALIVVMMYLLGRALLIDRPFLDFAVLAPAINSIGAIPVTPGGLGLREYAAVSLLGLVGVPAAKSLALSLGVYATMLFWSLVGGVVFLLYSGDSGAKLPDELPAEDG